MESPKIPRFCLYCGSHHFTNVFIYDSPPEGETKFQFSSSGSYLREVWRCNLCSHFISIHNMDISTLYDDDYVSSCYHHEDGIARAFKRIISLPPSQSDNTGRVQRILDFACFECIFQRASFILLFPSAIFTAILPCSTKDKITLRRAK